MYYQCYLLTKEKKLLTAIIINDIGHYLCITTYDAFFEKYLELEMSMRRTKTNFRFLRYMSLELRQNERNS